MILSGSEVQTFADVLVRCEASKCLQAAAEIVDIYRAAQARAELIVVVVVEAFYRRILDGPVHALDLTIRPWAARFGQAVLDVEISTGQIQMNDSEMARCPGA